MAEVREVRANLQFVFILIKIQMHVAFQAFNNPVALTQSLTLAQSEPQMSNVVSRFVTNTWFFFKI